MVDFNIFATLTHFHVETNKVINIVFNIFINNYFT